MDDEQNTMKILICELQLHYNKNPILVWFQDPSCVLLMVIDGD